MNTSVDLLVDLEAGKLDPVTERLLGGLRTDKPSLVTERMLGDLDAGSCAAGAGGYLRVCADGPVFDGEAVLL